MQDIVERRLRRKSEHYPAVYDAIIGHINRFSQLYDCDIYTNSVTEEFLDDFIIYLQNEGLRHNTIVGYVQKIQSMVRKASQYNYAVDTTYDEISMHEEESHAVFLSMNEIARIYYYKFTHQDKRRARERIRDLFVVGCLTALRYSDYSTLTKDNFQDGFIIKRTKKTNVTVRVPMHDYVREIIAKYDGDIPSGLCIQYFNKYLRLEMSETKIILDACCGSRMFWFDKHNPFALFVDKRSEIVTAKDRDKIRTIEVKPDIIADFTNLPFEDNSFYMVVFDPPHLKTLGETSWMAKKYGKLPKDWQSLIHDGFTECMRVLKPNGTLVFKWNESEIKAAEVLSVIPFKPLFGHTTGRQSKTIWMCFMKLPINS